MCARMTLQIKRIVEAFAAERAQISLDVRVTFHMSVEQSLQCERFAANLTCELVRIIVGNRLGRFLFAVTVTMSVAQRIVECERILEAMTAIDELELNLGWKTQLLEIILNVTYLRYLVDRKMCVLYTYAVYYWFCIGWCIH